jgi:hypothetical protein
LSWIAFKGIDHSTVLSRLGREDTGDEATNWSGVMAGASLAGGFYVVQLEECYDSLLAPDSLAALSQGGTLIGCQAEEHVMASACFAWHDGKLSWQLTHDSSDGVDDLKTEGAPPPELAPLRSRAATQQKGGDEDVDYFFSVPIDLAAAVVGFHHDHASRAAFASPSSAFSRLDKIE